MLTNAKTNQVMTPVVIVTAYYSTQEPVFGFPRNGRTFIIAVVIVYFVLRAFNVATVLARRYIRSNRIVALIALGQLEKLFDLETENGNSTMHTYSFKELKCTQNSKSSFKALFMIGKYQSQPLISNSDC